MNYKKLDTCYNCRRLYDNSVNALFCPRCEAEMADRIELMNEYLQNNKDATIEELSKTFNVRTDVIKILKKKKLLFTGKCYVCDATVSKDILCEDCKHKQIKGLSSITFGKPTLEETKAVMRFLSSRIS